jgi:hypothetical protein
MEAGWENTTQEVIKDALTNINKHGSLAGWFTISA